MTRSQVIRQLRSEGFAVTVGRIRQALENGYIKPLPKKAARGAYNFRAAHLQCLRWYLTHIRPGPTPGHLKELKVDGANDRIHRLLRKKQLEGGIGPSEYQIRLERMKKADVAIAWLEELVRQSTKAGAKD